MIPVSIQPITISKVKAEKVVFVQTAIVVAAQHLGEEMSFKTALYLQGQSWHSLRFLPLYFCSKLFSLLPNLLKLCNTPGLSLASTFRLFVENCISVTRKINLRKDVANEVVTCFVSFEYFDEKENTISNATNCGEANRRTLSL